MALAQKVENWVWILIYGGLLLVAFGLVVEDRDFPLGWSIVSAGCIAAAAGAVLIFVRSRMKAPE